MRRGPVPWQSHVLRASQHCPPGFTSLKNGIWATTCRVFPPKLAKCLTAERSVLIFVDKLFKKWVENVYVCCWQSKCPANMAHTAFGYSKPKKSAFLLRWFFLIKYFLIKSQMKLSQINVRAQQQIFTPPLPLFFNAPDGAKVTTTLLIFYFFFSW